MERDIERNQVTLPKESVVGLRKFIWGFKEISLKGLSDYLQSGTQDGSPFSRQLRLQISVCRKSSEVWPFKSM